jgi:hypothetical protein
MSKFLTLIFCLLILPISSFAISDWQETNNGGEGLLCNDSISGGVYYSMEYVEAQTRYNLKPDMKQLLILKDEREVAKSLVRRLPARAENIKVFAESMIDEFYKKVRWVSFPGDYSTMDGGRYRLLPEHCSFVQIALFTESKRRKIDLPYSLNKDIWPWLSVEQKGIVIAHEVLYRISISFGAPASSEALRFVIALLIANQLQTTTNEYAAKVLNQAHLFLAVDTPHLIH